MTTPQPNEGSPAPQPSPPQDASELTATPQPPADGTMPRRKRRWGRRIVILMLLLFAGVVGLVAAMPWALSRPQARETILGFVNDSIAGKVQFENVSLSWFDDLKVEGLRIADANNDEVVSAKSIYLGSGLASVARDPTRFAELRIDSPEIDLRMDEHNRPTLASAFAGKQRVTQSSPAGVESASQLPEIVGKIVITNGRVRVTPQSGQVQTVSDIEADVDIQSLNAIHGTLGFTAQGGSLMADANVDNLTREGRFDVCNASGRLKVTTKGECELGPLLAMLMPEQPVTGRGTLSIDADFKPDASSATIGAHVWDLHVVNSSNAGGAPLEMTLNGDFALAGTQLNGSVDLKGSPGEANVKLAADTAQVMPNLSTDSIMAALFGGESMALPAFSLDATSRIDLAQVERALPGVLEFQPGQAVRTGVIHVERVAVRGGKSPTVEAVAELTDASVTRNGAETRIAPMHVDLNAKVGESQGLSVDKLIVDAGFGAINASGTPRDMNVRFNGDLAAAKRDLGPFVNLGDVDVSGKVEGTLAMSRSTDDRVALDATVNTSQARLRVGEKSFDLNQTTIAQKGQLTLANNKPVRYRAEELRVNLDQQIVMSGSGSYEVESREFEADVKLDRGDLDFLAKRADMIGAPDLKRFRGQLAGNIKLHGDRDRNIETTGQLAASQLTSDGQPVLRDNLDINWKDVSYRDGGKKLQIALASLASQEATIDITNANIDLVSGDSASGKIRANADLQGVFGAVGRFSNMEKPPALKGRLNLDGDIRQSSSGLQFAAIGGVTQLEIGEGAGAVREDKVDLKLDAAIDPRQKMIRLGRNELSSGLLSAQLSGRIDQYDTDAVAKLDGEYSTQWQAITKLIEELSPGTGKLVSIHGTSRSKISLSGPLNRKGDTPPYRGATGAAAVTWDSADIVGIKLTKAQVDMKIDKGEFIIAPTTIGAAQGRVNLASRYDIASSTLRIPGRVATLEGVMFTPELSRELLSRINPVFYHVVSAEGNVELLMNNLELPLAKDAAGGGGHGKLTLKNAKIEPGGILGELIKFGIATTTGERISVALEGADFDVHDGRIHYENFAMIFPYEFDLRFRGSVGLDETVDLVVSIPVRPELLQRLGVKGPVAQYAEVLTGSRIDIPIAGTRENPKLELSKVATDGLIKEAIKRTTEKGAGDAIKGLAGGLLGGGDAKADKGGKADAGKDKGNKAGNDKPEKEKAAKGTGAKGKEKEKGKDKKKKKGIEGIIPGIGG